MEIVEVSIIELKNMLESNNDFVLLDVRTEIETLASSISNHSIHIPMNEIPNRLNELDKNKETIIHCKSGKRSKKVCNYLIENNFTNVKNLKGGILAWSNEIDPSVLVY